MVLLLTLGITTVAGAVATAYLINDSRKLKEELANEKSKAKASIAYAEDMIALNKDLSQSLQDKIDELNACLNSKIANVVATKRSRTRDKQ